VLYSTPERWRFALYFSKGVADGALDIPANAPIEEAQTDLVARAEDFAGGSLQVIWRTDEPGWWSGEVTGDGEATSSS
jgi:hypothetical protein